jgi:hypothetical protein
VARRTTLGALVGWLIGLVSLALLVTALIRTWEESQERVLPEPWQWIVAAVLVPLVPLCSATGWALLFEGRGDRRWLRHSFYAAQIAKYVPGGITQVVSQVALSQRAGVGSSHAAAMFAVHALVGAVSTGGTFAIPVGILDRSLDPWLRAAFVAGGVLAVALLHRRWMVWLLDDLSRRWARIPDGGVVPSQSALLRAYAVGLLAFLINGLAFAVLVGPDAGIGDWALLVGAYSIAFTVGFLVLPVPSGIGVREGTLFLLLGGRIDTAVVISASLVHRLIYITIAEVLVLVITSAGRLRPTSTRLGARRSGRRVVD